MQSMPDGEHSLQRTGFTLPYNLPVLCLAEFLVLGEGKDCTVVNSPGLLHRLTALPVRFLCAIPSLPRDSLVSLLSAMLSAQTHVHSLTCPKPSAIAV